MKKLVTSKLFLSILTVLVFLFGLSQTISYPEYDRVVSFKLDNVQQGVIHGNVVLDLENDNWFSYTGRDLVADIFYKNKKIAVGTNPSPFRLERKSNNTVSLQIEFFMDSLKEELQTFLLQDSLVFDIRVSGRFSFLRIPMSKSMKLQIPATDLVNDLVSSLMQDGGINITKVNLKELTPRFSLFTVGFEMKNNLPITVELSKLHFSVFGEKTETNRLATCDFKVDGILNPGDTKEINGDVRLDNVQSALSSIGKILTGELTYFLSGKATVMVDKYQILVPIKQAFTLDLSSRKISIEE